MEDYFALKKTQPEKLYVDLEYMQIRIFSSCSPNQLADRTFADNGLIHKTLWAELMEVRFLAENFNVLSHIKSADIYSIGIFSRTFLV